MTKHLPENLIPEKPQSNPKIEDSKAGVGVLLPISAFGFSFLLALFYLALFSDLPTNIIGNSADSFFLRVSVLVGIIGVFTVLMYKPELQAQINKHMIVLILLAMCPAALFALLSMTISIPIFVHIFLWLLLGCGHSFLLMGWYSIFTVSWEVRVNRYIALSYIQSAVLILFITNLVSVFEWLAFLLLPLLSLLTFYYVKNHLVTTNSKDKKKNIARLRNSTGFIIFLYNTLFGFTSYILLTSVLNTFSNLIIFGAVFFAGVLNFAIVQISKKYIPYATLLKLGIPFIALGFLVMIFADDSVRFFCCLYLCALFVSLELANNSSNIAIGSDHLPKAVRVLALSRRGPHMGIGIGWIICMLLSYYMVDYTQEIAVVSLGVIFFLSIVTTIVPIYSNTIEDKESDEEAKGGGLYKRKCDKTSQKYNLSEREQDVFWLLAKGRNAEYISTELNISAYTAKTHIYHIYRKMDINTHQELISIVEGTGIGADIELQ